MLPRFQDSTENEDVQIPGSRIDTLRGCNSDSARQVDLSTYADANSFLNVQKLTCTQLAGTWQGDADRLTTWYSGWYNGLARKHYVDFVKGKEVEHEVIVYCKANPDQLIIEAIAVVFKDMRVKLGIEMKP